MRAHVLWLLAACHGSAAAPAAPSDTPIASHEPAPTTSATSAIVLGGAGVDRPDASPCYAVLASALEP
jgi:hypothetical protein